MRPYPRSKLLVALVALAAFLATLSPANAQSKRDVDRAREEKEAAYKELLAINQQLGDAIAHLEETQERLEDLERTVGRLDERISEYRTQADELQVRARNLVMEAYVNGGNDLIGTAFSATSIQDLLTGQVVLDRATSRDALSIDRLRAISREMDRLTAELDDRRAQVAELEAEQAELVAQLADTQARAEALYREARSKYRGVYARYQAELRRRAAAEAARRSGAARGLPSTATKGVVCPVKGPTWFTDTWGAPRSGGRTHKGTDMAAAYGTPLVAMYSGTVRVNTHYLGGKQVYVYGDNGIFYYYAHLSRWASGLSTGDRVKKGQVIGYVGTTGNATGPVLHLGMGPIGGGFVNPYPTVRSVC